MFGSQRLFLSWRYLRLMIRGRCESQAAALLHTTAEVRRSSVVVAVGYRGGDFRPGTVSQGIISPPLKSPKPQASMCLTKCLSIFEK